LRPVVDVTKPTTFQVNADLPKNEAIFDKGTNRKCTSCDCLLSLDQFTFQVNADLPKIEAIFDKVTNRKCTSCNCLLSLDQFSWSSSKELRIIT
jgi:hypothetical protein